MKKDFFKEKLAYIIMHGYRRIFLISLMIVFSMQMIVFLQDKLTLLHENMYEDFRIITVVEQGSSDQAVEDLFTSLNEQKSIYEAEYVSLENVIEEFETLNPQISKDVLKIEENIFEGYFEITPKKSTFTNMVSWVKNNVEKHEIVEKVYYNLAQVDMMNNINGFSKFLNFAIWFIVILAGLFFFFVETSKQFKQEFTSYRGFVSGALAGLFGLAILFIFFFPVKALNPEFWTFLPVYKQLLLVLFGGFIGWVLYRWQER
ncbi:MAG: hypothetical protein HOD04_03280 [Elusimicrobiaceae bacterium]|jgi:cell division protein FtsX|nr:hypothetical protein [Elusimicrobiaceae bacterium]MBT4007928.1 hypothetical protein [Elusimicrobiaceae bacterium]MBT4403146.1 hypothetical protein [Elusimicrobiaceae bacterium]MBT4439942.1 hypothetical protein [Elusimicrobiaceae bacterium]MBT5987961.1 hypothetical protein [Elusimicrobiaceae bacterium]